MNDGSRLPDDFAIAFDAAATRLRESAAAACARRGPWPARVCAAIQAVVQFATTDPAAARLLLVDHWSQGVDGAARHERLLDGFARQLAGGRDQLTGGRDLPTITEQVQIGAIVGILTQRLLSDERITAPAQLAAELAEFTLLPYLGPTRARAWARRARVEEIAGPAGTNEPNATVRRVEFTEVLRVLQGMIGEDVRVVVNLVGHFFDCGFSAPLERVETLSGDDGAVLVVLADAQGIALDPAELESLLGTWPTRHASRWLELHVGQQLRLVIEPLTGPPTP